MAGLDPDPTSLPPSPASKIASRELTTGPTAMRPQWCRTSRMPESSGETPWILAPAARPPLWRLVVGDVAHRAVLRHRPARDRRRCRLPRRVRDGHLPGRWHGEQLPGERRLRRRVAGRGARAPHRPGLAAGSPSRRVALAAHPAAARRRRPVRGPDRGLLHRRRAHVNPANRRPPCSWLWH